MLAHLVVHLLRAVKYVDHDAEGSAQVFGSLSLPCACGPCWSSTHGQVEGLGQGDVASKYSQGTRTYASLMSNKKLLLTDSTDFHLLD